MQAFVSAYMTPKHLKTQDKYFVPLVELYFSDFEMREINNIVETPSPLTTEFFSTHELYLLNQSVESITKTDEIFCWRVKNSEYGVLVSVSDRVYKLYVVIAGKTLVIRNLTHER